MGRGSGCVERGVIHCVFDQIPNLQIALPPQTKPRRGGGFFRQINTCHYWSIFKKSLLLGFGVFIAIWSMVGTWFSVVQAGGGDRREAGARIAPL